MDIGGIRMARNFQLITQKEFGDDYKVFSGPTGANATTNANKKIGLPEIPSVPPTDSGDDDDTGNVSDTSKPKDFVYNDTKPGGYTSKWGTQTQNIIDQFANREFSYDINSDKLYQQYVDQYTRMGSQASKDVAGQVAAMTGGYGSSYAAAASSQAYQSYLDQLNDKALDFQQMAYDRYRQEGADMLSQYGMLVDQDSADYSKYRDEVNDYYTDRNFEYGKYRDEVTDYETGRMNDATLESQGLSKVTNLISMGATPSAEDLKAAGLSQSQYNSMKKTYDESLEIAADSGENSFGEFTATEFCDKMAAFGVIFNSNDSSTEEKRQAQKDALAFISAAGRTDGAWEIYNLYFGDETISESSFGQDILDLPDNNMLTYEGINPQNDPHEFAKGLNIDLATLVFDPLAHLSATPEQRAEAENYFNAFSKLPEDTQKKLLADAGYEID